MASRKSTSNTKKRVIKVKAVPKIKSQPHKAPKTNPEISEKVTSEVTMTTVEVVGQTPENKDTELPKPAEIEPIATETTEVEPQDDKNRILKNIFDSAGPIHARHQSKIAPVYVKPVTDTLNIQQTSKPDHPEKVLKSKKSGFGLYGFMGFVVGVVIGLISFAGFYYLNLQKLSTTPKSSETTDNLTPTIEMFDKSQVFFEILNGSGVRGVAGRAAEYLEDLGYQVGSIGNHDELSDDIRLFLRSELEADREMILSDISKNYKSATYAGELTEGTYSARLIIGKE